MNETNEMMRKNGVKAMLSHRLPRNVLAVPCALLVLLGMHSWRLIDNVAYTADDGMEVLALPNPLGAAQRAHYMAAAASRSLAATNAPGRTVTSVSAEKIARDVPP